MAWHACLCACVMCVWCAVKLKNELKIFSTAVENYSNTLCTMLDANIFASALSFSLDWIRLVVWLSRISKIPFDVSVHLSENYFVGSEIKCSDGLPFKGISDIMASWHFGILVPINIK